MGQGQRLGGRAGAAGAAKGAAGGRAAGGGAAGGRVNAAGSAAAASVAAAVAAAGIAAAGTAEHEAAARKLYYGLTLSSINTYCCFHVPFLTSCAPSCRAAPFVKHGGTGLVEPSATPEA